MSLTFVCLIAGVFEIDTSFFTFFFEATLYYCIRIYDDFLTFFFDPSWQRIAQNSAKISNIFYLRVRVKKDVDGKFDDENE